MSNTRSPFRVAIIALSLITATAFSVTAVDAASSPFSFLTSVQEFFGVHTVQTITLSTQTAQPTAAPTPESFVPQVDTLGDYRSAVSGNWNAVATWERFDGTNWVVAVATPTSADGVITIRNSHTVTVTAAVTVDQVIVDSGGLVTINAGIGWTIANGTSVDLTINGTVLNSGLALFGAAGPTWIVNSGGTYVHNTTSGISTPLNGVTLDAASNFIYRGATGLVPATSTSGRTYGNLAFDVSSGNYTVSPTGSGTLTVNGNFSIGSGVTYQTSQSGVMTFAGNLTNNGTLINSTNTQIYTFTGVGRTISGNSSISFETWNINSGASISLGRNITVANGFVGTVSGTLNCGTNIISGDTFTLASGSTLGIGDPNGITTNLTFTGNIQTDTRNFDSGATYIYNGSANQVTGNGLPSTVNSLTIANTGTAGNNTVTLGSNITGPVTVSSGVLNGTATITGAVTVNNGGTVAPGLSPGILNTGNVTFNSGSTYAVEIGGTTPGNTSGNHDQLNVTGTVNLGAGVSNLVASSFNGFVPNAGNTFTIINNDGSDAVNGNFAGFPQGATISTNFLNSGRTATISYTGGDGNDVMITVSASTNPSGVGSATPGTVVQGGDVLLTMTVTPGTNPTSTGLTVTGDLSSIGGSATQAFFDNGTNGDTTAGDNIFNFSTTVALATAPGLKSLPTTINDAQARTGNANISLTVTPIPVPGTLQFSSATYSGGEGAGTIALTVTRTGGTDGAVSAQVSFSGGTATGGATCGGSVDYDNDPFTVMFADGSSTSQVVNVPVCDDTVFETPDETFGASLGSFTGGATAGSPSSTTVTITENDTQPTFAFLSSTFLVNEGAGTIGIQVNRSGALGGTDTVDAATVAGGTATAGTSCTAGVDYLTASGTLTFNPTETNKSLMVTICDDAVFESPNETVNLALSNPSANATLGTPNTAVLTIDENDGDTTAPVITYTPISSNPPMTALNATITDAVGVTGATIFWSINGGSFTSAACSLSGGTPQNGTWSCTITGASNPNAVAYYVTATDAAMNTATNPAGGATAPNLFTIGAATVPAGTYTNLNLGNGVSLGGNVVVNSNLTLNGIVNTGANSLTLECGATITGGGEFSYVVGNLEKRFCGIGLFTFHVGAPFALPLSPEDTTLAPEGQISNYSPLTVNITAGTVNSSLTVSVTDAFMVGTVEVNSISRYWTVTENGNLTADMSYIYRNEDVVGIETSYNVLREAGGMVANYPGGTVNPATNTATAPGVTNFSQWGAGTAIPTAAGVSLSGRLADAYGNGIRNAIVKIEGGGLTEPRFKRTGSFGHYGFDGLPAGQTYIVTVISKRYTFAEPTRVITLNDSVDGYDFTAEPE